MARSLVLHRAKVAALRGVNMLRGKRSIHLLHIGKTGGTAVKAAIQESDAVNSLIIHPHGVTLRDIAPGDGVIFFVRDPVTRFVSGFYSRKRQGRPGHKVPWSRAERTAFEQFATPDALATALDDKAEDRRLASHHAMNSIEHVRSSYWNWFIDEQFMESRWDDIVFVGQLESLGDDFEALKRVMGWPGDLELPRDPDKAHQSPVGEDRQLSNAAIGNLANWFADDYRFLELCSDRRVALLGEPFTAAYDKPDPSAAETP